MKLKKFTLPYPEKPWKGRIVDHPVFRYLWQAKKLGQFKLVDKESDYCRHLFYALATIHGYIHGVEDRDFVEAGPREVLGLNQLEFLDIFRAPERQALIVDELQRCKIYSIIDGKVAPYEEPPVEPKKPVGRPPLGPVAGEVMTFRLRGDVAKAFRELAGDGSVSELLQQAVFAYMGLDTYGEPK